MAMTEEERKAYMKEWRIRNKEKQKEYNKKYLKTEKGKAKQKEYNKKRCDLAKNTNDMFLKAYLRLKHDEIVYKNQEESLKTATNKGKWTQEEIEFLLTSSLTLFDKAIYLKRSYSSVMSKQAKLKKAQL